MRTANLLFAPDTEKQYLLHHSRILGDARATVRSLGIRIRIDSYRSRCIYG